MPNDFIEQFKSLFRKVESSEGDGYNADAILSYLPDSFILLDPDGLIIKVNRATTEMFACSEEELLGKHYGTILEGDESFDMLQGLIEAGSVREFELVYLSRHGRKIPVSCTGSILTDSNGSVEGIVCIAKDITVQKQAEMALKESEERFRMLFENVPIGIYRMTTQGDIVQANSALRRMLGYQTIEELTASTKEIFDSAFPREEIKKKAEAEGQALGIETAWRRRDGRIIHVRENVKMMRDRTGNLLFFEGTVEDITEHKKMEQMKNEFISIVSHELRVPLTSIHGSLGWLSDKMGNDLPERAKKMIQIASRSSDRMVRLINDMLDIDKIESGKMTFYLRTIDVQSLMEQAIEANQPYAEQFSVKLQLKATAEGIRIKADSDRLMQVLTNLISNAAKFSPQNDTVDIGAFKNNGMIRFSVTDHGPGIPEKFRTRIFEKFVQVRTADPRQKGTGLGLSISKAIVEKLGGAIGFEVQSGKGTTFFFDLPEIIDESSKA